MILRSLKYNSYFCLFLCSFSVMSSLEDSLRMLDYYCQHKTTKDTVIVFYHTAKKLSEHDGSHVAHTLDQKFSTYFEKRDVSQLDREYQQAMKATRHIIQRHKTNVQVRASVNASNKQLSSVLLTPNNSINLEINSNRGKKARGQLYESDVFKTSWNHEFASDDVKTMKFENAQSVISQFGTNPSHTPHSNLSSELQNYHSQMIREYQNHQLDLAYKTSINIQNLLKHSNIKDRSTEKLRGEINEVQSQYSQMLSYYRQFDQPGWQFDNTTKNITLHSKTINNGQHVAVLISAELNIPLINFLVMIQEIDLFSNFVPFCGAGEQIKRVQRNLYVARSTVDVPLLTNRQTYFYAKMIDRLATNDSLFFYSRSINNNPEVCSKYGVTVPEKSKYVRLQYNFFIVECKILASDRFSVRMASSVDMKLNFIPNFILMMSARKFALQYFMNILKEQDRFYQSEWYNRLKQKRSIYGYYQQIIDKYLGEN